MQLSVVSINYNNKDGLEKTILSVLSQSFKDYEYIIIDGGSTDGSVDVIKKYSEYISYWVSEPDKGIYNALNKGVAVMNGDYCIFMNSGDCFYDEDSIYKTFELSKGSDIICGNTFLGYFKTPPQDVTMEFLFDNSICHQCAFIKSDIMKKYGYDENYKIVSDRKFFLQALIFDNCSYESVDVNVVRYDITGFSAVNPVLSRIEYDKVLEELFPYRVRVDYGKKNRGVLYGDGVYEKFFAEVGRRRYKSIIYRLSVSVLKFLSFFKNSARFSRMFPNKI